MSAIRLHDDRGLWTVQATTTGRGERYRYHCKLCGNNGPWRVNGNDADGDDHLAAKHGMG